MTWSCLAKQGTLLLLALAPQVSTRKHVRAVVGCCAPTLRAGWMAGKSEPPRWLAAGTSLRGLVGRLSMHPEAVDACVLRVAPVGQDPELHDLVCGHIRSLGRKRGGSVSLSPLTPHQQRRGGVGESYSSSQVSSSLGLKTKTPPTKKQNF